MQSYSAAEKAAVGHEMLSARGQHWPQWIVDYGKLRAQIATCKDFP